MAHIDIRMLGKLDIRVDGEDILPRLGASRKKLALIQFFVLHRGRGFSAEQLNETLWPGEENTNPENAIKTLISRLRRDLEKMDMKGAIVTRKGAYTWNEDLDVWVDVFESEELASELAKAKKLDKKTESQFERLLFLYQDDLVNVGGNDAWLTSRSMHCHSLYIKAIYRYLHLLDEQERFKQAVSVCRRALEIDALDSQLNLELMTALLKLGRGNEAFIQYEYAMNQKMARPGIWPSAEVLDFYRELVRDENTVEADLQVILKELWEVDEKPGAFVCDYSVFKDVFRLHRGNLKRLGIPMFVALLSVRRIDGEGLEPMLQEKTMQTLLEVIRKNLRQGDIISRYSSNQYIILLSNIQYETGRIVMERLRQQFFEHGADPRFTLCYRLAAIPESR